METERRREGGTAPGAGPLPLEDSRAETRNNFGIWQRRGRHVQDRGSSLNSAPAQRCSIYPHCGRCCIMHLSITQDAPARHGVSSRTFLSLSISEDGDTHTYPQGALGHSVIHGAMGTWEAIRHTLHDDCTPFLPSHLLM